MQLSHGLSQMPNCRCWLVSWQLLAVLPAILQGFCMAMQCEKRDSQQALPACLRQLMRRDEHAEYQETCVGAAVWPITVAKHA